MKRIITAAGGPVVWRGFREACSTGDFYRGVKFSQQSSFRANGCRQRRETPTTLSISHYLAVVSSTFPLFLTTNDWVRGYACVLKTVAVSAKKLIDSRCVRRFVQAFLPLHRRHRSELH
jgi:hypothetical protein